MIIDFHTHTFPETIAAHAIPALEQRGKIKAALNGTVPDLLQSMHHNKISQSVICSIATTPKQFEPILSWSKDIKTGQIIPLPSVHPESKTIFQELETIKKNGFKGIKLHPYYQDFFLDEDRLLPLFLQIADLGLFVVMHCGYDIGFPREERANPEQIKKLITAIPSLKFIAAHLGGWQQWDDVATHLIGKDVYMDLAFVLNFLPQTQAVKMIQNHPENRILFGSDSPWADQKTAIEQLQKLQLEDALEKRILYLNGQELLGL